ncbi:MAG TPA: type II toxin-antitoxin system VapC family toxin [Gordonia sp. (in: high G+C Gram-positive bacteria)]|uniref:type II toxin-antitoxin system VapC family toxin n=1 Tax=Gordonia sp. (in: high G+C Gram-positive bacteria) TaxID=84139 RepID=UPI0025C2D0E2|nr:type II toxin-antitoxin system VapC family toxin [Gordonia sp. (in: high G+C Gram-positive bacteria)]HQV17568.1 type II toxin-antitoxin system VapC family toxin [Gordonia sp. (in: high G+C Gram-positive bacteria)]
MILDASAVLAFLNDEPGADTVADAIPGALISAANLAEVLGKVGDWGGDIVGIEERLRAAGLQVAPVQADDAVVVAALRQLDGGTALSLGDRCCLTLGLRHRPATVLTSDRAWAELDLPIDIALIR